MHLDRKMEEKENLVLDYSPLSLTEPDGVNKRNLAKTYIYLHSTIFSQDKA